MPTPPNSNSSNRGDVQSSAGTRTTQAQKKVGTVLESAAPLPAHHLQYMHHHRSTQIYSNMAGWSGYGRQTTYRHRVRSR